MPCFSSSPNLEEQLSKDDWKLNFNLISATYIGTGGSGTVFAIDKKRVIKVFPRDDRGRRDYERERAIYYKLQSGEVSKNILKFSEEWRSGLVLERHDKTMRQLLSSALGITPFTLQWSKEVCEGLAFLHQKDILHGDLGCQNIMVDSSNHAKLCDFAGSKFRDGDNWRDAWISYEVRSQHPEFRGKQPTVKTEIFALGSVLFEIWTSSPPYASETDIAVQQKFLAREFPFLIIDNAKMQSIVEKCWMGDYMTVAHVCKDLEKV